MTQVPPAPPFDITAKLMEWDAAKKALATAQAREILLRLEIFKHIFPDPKEGTNTFVLPSKWQVKGVYKINRSVDKVVLNTYRTIDPATGKTPLQLNNISDAIIKWTPDVNMTLYKELTKEQRQFFDNTLTIKEGTPGLSIEEPSKRGAKTAVTPPPGPAA